MNKYSISIARAVNAYLKKDNWKYSFDNEEGLFNFSLSLQCKIKTVDYLIRIREDDFIVYAVSSISADENDPEGLNKLAEFFCRANYGIRNGNFEMDYSDGEIRYKSYVDCEDITPSDAMIRNGLYVPATMFERYAAGILAVLFGGSDPEEAVRACEEDLQ